MKVKTSELSVKQSKIIFGKWFEREFREQLKEMNLPAMEQRRLMNMSWYGWHAHSLLGDEVEIPDELMETTK